MSSLAEALPMEQQRVREIRDLYLELPDGAGKPAAAMMEMSLRQAEVAASSGDVIAMMRAHEDLKGYTL